LRHVMFSRYLEKNSCSRAWNVSFSRYSSVGENDTQKDKTEKIQHLALGFFNYTKAYHSLIFLPYIIEACEQVAVLGLNIKQRHNAF